MIFFAKCHITWQNTWVSTLEDTKVSQSCDFLWFKTCFEWTPHTYHSSHIFSHRCAPCYIWHCHLKKQKICWNTKHKKTCRTEEDPSELAEITPHFKPSVQTEWVKIKFFPGATVSLYFSLMQMEYYHIEMDEEKCGHIK